jgi:PAS domain S-box-containing protein
MLDSVRVFEYVAAFDALDIGVIVIDERRCIVGWNDWIAKVSGCARDAALGRTISDLFPIISDTRLPAVIEDSFQFGSSSILTHSLNALLPLHGEGGAELLHNIIVRPILSNQSNFCLLQVNDVTVSVTRERTLIAGSSGSTAPPNGSSASHRRNCWANRLTCSWRMRAALSRPSRR